MGKKIARIIGRVLLVVLVTIVMLWELYSL